MKKVLITMAMLTSMVVGAMVCSSFTAPKQENIKYSEFTIADGWTRVGAYTGTALDGSTHPFVIWEKEGMCNSYYWVDRHNQGEKNPDEVSSTSAKGVLRQNNEKKWYAAYGGTNYFIDF